MTGAEHARSPVDGIRFGNKCADAALLPGFISVPTHCVSVGVCRRSRVNGFIFIRSNPHTPSNQTCSVCSRWATPPKRVADEAKRRDGEMMTLRNPPLMGVFLRAEGESCGGFPSCCHFAELSEKRSFFNIYLQRGTAAAVGAI